MRSGASPPPGRGVKVPVAPASSRRRSTPPPQATSAVGKGEACPQVGDPQGWVRYSRALDRLKECGGGERLKDATARSALGALRELAVLPQHATCDLLKPLHGFVRCERRDTQPFVLLLLWLAVSKGPVAPATFAELSKQAQGAISIDVPEVRRSSLTIVLMLNLLQYTNKDLALVLQPGQGGFVDQLMKALRRSLELKSHEKRGLTVKIAVWHEEKKSRLQAHLAGLTLLGHLFMHVFSHMQGQMAPVIELLAHTAIEYSYKEKEIPVVRECVAALGKVAEVAPGEMRMVESHLPIPHERQKDWANAALRMLHAGPPERTAKKERKGQEVGTLPCWDPFAAAALVRLCLTVLQKFDRRAALTSPFYKTLVLLMHHSDKHVFSEAVFGIVRRSGLFYVLLQTDPLYSTTETLMDYVVETRAKSMIMGTAHVECHAGLRLAAALCEQALEAARDDRSDSVLRVVNNSFARFEDEVVACRGRYSFDPLVTVQALKTQVWHTVIVLMQGDAAPGRAFRARRLLTELVAALSVSPVVTQNTLDLLKTMVRALKAMPPGGKRELLRPAFTGLITFLAARCVQKLSVLGFYGVLQEYLLYCDTVAPAQQDHAHRYRGPLDVDEIPYQRPNGGLGTLELVLCLLDGSLSAEAANAEQAATRMLGSRGADPSRERRGRQTQLLVELVRFVGDFASVIANGRPTADSDQDSGRCLSNVLLLLSRLKAMAYMQPQHLVWEAGLAMVKVAARSVPAVRVAVYAALAEVAEARGDCAAMLAPLLGAVDELMSLLALFESMSGAGDAAAIGADPDAVAVQFHDMHERLRHRLAVHVSFGDDFRLLGPDSQQLLDHAKTARSTRRRPQASAAVPQGPDMLFCT